MKRATLFSLLLLTLILGVGIGFFAGNSNGSKKRKLEKAIARTGQNKEQKGNPQDSVILEKASTGYYTGRGIWAPCAVLTFRNTSARDFTYPPDNLKVEVVFFNEDTKEQLYANTKSLVGPVSNPRLGAGASYQLHFVSTKGWAVIPFGTRIIARIYLGHQLIKTVEINEFEISLTGKRVTLFGDEDF